MLVRLLLTAEGEMSLVDHVSGKRYFIGHMIAANFKTKISW
jgi:hypothetical protein